MNALNFVDKTDTEYLTEQKDWGNLDRPGMDGSAWSLIYLLFFAEDRECFIAWGEVGCILLVLSYDVVD